MQRVCEAIPLRRFPEIPVSEVLPTPVLLGVQNPLNVLSAELMRIASRQRIAEVLMHECAHIVPRDPFGHIMQQISSGLYWSHSGVAWGSRELTRAREALCDNHVLQQTVRPTMSRHCFSCRRETSGNPLVSHVWGCTIRSGRASKEFVNCWIPGVICH